MEDRKRQPYRIEKSILPRPAVNILGGVDPTGVLLKDPRRAEQCEGALVKQSPLQLITYMIGLFR